MPGSAQALGSVQTLASPTAASVKPSLMTSTTRLPWKTAKSATSQMRTPLNSLPVTTEDMTFINPNANLQPNTSVLPSGP
jgi:hypothetical protein